VNLDELEKQDGEFLLGRAEYQRFLLRVIQLAGIFSRTTDGSGERNLSFDEGRRSLGLEILEMAEAAQPQVHSLIVIPGRCHNQRWKRWRGCRPRRRRRQRR
jgi:hypothetical protein